MKRSKFYLFLSNGLIGIMLLSLGVFAFVDPIQSVVVPNALKVYYNGNTKSNYVSLMVNIYWGNEYLDSMLKIFKDNNIKTTFFVGGIWAEKYEEELLKIVACGHEIGNHGYFHKSQDTLSYEENQSEILNNHKLIKNIAGVTMNLFAPPGGAYCDATLQAANNLGYKTIMWTKDTIDWRDQDKDLIVTRVTKNLKGGDLILMHPTKSTVESLQDIINIGMGLGLEFVNVSKNILNS